MLAAVKKWGGLLSGLFLIAGCQTFGQTTNQIDRDGIDIIYSTSDAKLTYIKKKGNPEILCAPREGDIADTYSSGGGIGFSVAGNNDTVTDDDAKGALALGGRNPEVLLARELMFRACELASNTNADNKTSMAIYSFFLNKLVELSKSTSGTGTSSSYSGITNPASNILVNSSQSVTNDSTSNNNNANQNNGGNNNTGNAPGNGGNQDNCDPKTDWNCPIKH